MIKEAIAQLIEGAGLGLTRGTDIFVDFGEENGVLVTSDGEQFTLDQTTEVCELEVQILIKGYNTAQGDALAKSILPLVDGSAGTHTLDTGGDVRIIGITARGKVNYRDPETKARTVSMNFGATYHTL